MAKRSKKSVGYRDWPRDNEWCSKCQHFLPPNACEGVAGEISSTGWCVRFKAKGNKSMAKDWYGKKGKDGEGEKKPQSMHERHAHERMETHKRHGAARDAMHKQQEEELAQMNQRHMDEAAMAPGDGAPGGEPAGGAMNTAGAGAAAGTPAGVAGAQAA